MSGITVTVSPEAFAAFERQAATMRRACEVIRAQATQMSKLVEAVRRSPRYKAQEAKRRLVAIVNAYTPAQVLGLFASLAQISRTFEGWFSEEPPPFERTLLTTQGPHAPPLRSVIRHGASRVIT